MKNLIDIETLGPELEAVAKSAKGSTKAEQLSSFADLMFVIARHLGRNASREIEALQARLAELERRTTP